MHLKRPIKLWQHPLRKKLENALLPLYVAVEIALVVKKNRAYNANCAGKLLFHLGLKLLLLA